MNLTATHSDAGKRLDVFITENIAELNRSFVDKLIDDKKVKVNNEPVRKAGQKIKESDVVLVEFKPSDLNAAEELDLPILYEDEDCIVIDKPAGILTHSKGAYNPEATVASFIAPKVGDMTGERAGIVHRLDRATSGVIVCAKNEAAQTLLQKEFSTRKVKKTYIAITNSGITPKQAIIDIPIERSPANPKFFIASNNGKPAQTEYKVVSENSKFCMVQLMPRTGRTHQLRVHLKYIGYPIIGDTFYGGPDGNRLYLHAISLELKLPSGEHKLFESPLPDEFSEVMK